MDPLELCVSGKYQPDLATFAGPFLMGVNGAQHKDIEVCDSERIRWRIK